MNTKCIHIVCRTGKKLILSYWQFDETKRIEYELNEIEEEDLEKARKEGYWQFEHRHYHSASAVTFFRSYEYVLAR